MAGQTVAPAAPPPSEFAVFKDKSAVHEFLARTGVECPEDVNPCLKAGLLNGHIKVKRELSVQPDASAFLDEVLVSGGCEGCSAEVQCTVRDALGQPTTGGHDYCEGNLDGAAQCSNNCGGMCVALGLRCLKLHACCDLLDAVCAWI